MSTEPWESLDASEKFKIKERYIVNVMRRAVPGEYRHLCDIDNDNLRNMGFDFTTAVALPPTNLFRDIAYGGRTARKTLKSLTDNPDSWHFALNGRDSSKAEDLQLAVWTETPHRVMTGIMDAACVKTPAMLIYHKGGDRKSVV